MRQKKWLITIGLSILFFAFVISFPQNFSSINALALARSLSGPHINWNQTYPIVGAHASVIQTLDGGYAIASDRFLKTDSLGNVQWEKTLGAVDVVQLSDGGYMLANKESLTGIDTIGNIVWSNTLNRTGGGYATSVIQTNDGGYVLGGYTNYGPGATSDFWLLKTDASGSLQWSKAFDKLTNNDKAKSVIETSDGGFALFGTTTPNDGGEGRFWLVKINSEGKLEWDKTYGGSDKNEGFSVVQVTDGGFVMGGEIWLRSDRAGFRAALVKTDASGVMLWNQTYMKGLTRAMVQTSDGGYALVGSFGLIKTDESGNLQWNQPLEMTADSVACSVVQTTDGGYAVAGGDSDTAWLFKVVDPSVVSPSPTTTPTSQPASLTILEPVVIVTVLLIAVAICLALIVNRKNLRPQPRAHLASTLHL